MEVTPLSESKRRPRSIAIGEFDGVHLGHREVIKGADTVLTFDPHPRAVINPEAAPKLITPLAIKTALIASLGVEELIVIPFNKEFSSQTAQEFIDHVLVEQLGAHQISVGENFRFGKKASGDVALLQAQDSFETRVAKLVEVEGEIVNSTHIRGLVVAGNIERANRFLGDPFQYWGAVEGGDRRGRELGFPTANLIPSDDLLHPGNGVYACIASLGRPESGDERTYAAAVNVGVRPTFKTGRGVLIEAYLLNFTGDIYGSELRLKFISRLRGEKRFEQVDDLIAQMHRDVAEVDARLRLGR
jgi:riboflavin kinase/FMN adenylyltransferase